MADRRPNLTESELPSDGPITGWLTDDFRFANPYYSNREFPD